MMQRHLGAVHYVVLLTDSLAVVIHALNARRHACDKQRNNDMRMSRTKSSGRTAIGHMNYK